LTLPSGGSRHCSICNEDLGRAELFGQGFIWPQGFEHYVRRHNVRPPQEFVDLAKSAQALQQRSEQQPSEQQPSKSLGLPIDLEYWKQIYKLVRLSLAVNPTFLKGVVNGEYTEDVSVLRWAYAVRDLQDASGPQPSVKDYAPPPAPPPVTEELVLLRAFDGRELICARCGDPPKLVQSVSDGGWMLRHYCAPLRYTFLRPPLHEEQVFVDRMRLALLAQSKE
jgi:hypothetical protein